MTNTDIIKLYLDCFEEEFNSLPLDDLRTTIYKLLVVHPAYDSKRDMLKTISILSNTHDKNFIKANELNQEEYDKLNRQTIIDCAKR